MSFPTRLTLILVILYCGTCSCQTDDSTSFTQNDQMASASGQNVSVSGVAAAGSSNSQISGSGFVNQDPNRFAPSPYAAQYQNSLQDMLGSMQMQMRNPWNGGPVFNGPFGGPNGMSMPMMPPVPGQTSFGMMTWTLPDPPVTQALATLNTPGDSTARGVIVFTLNQDGSVNITGNVTGLQPGSVHGFHVHQYGDLSNGCMSAGSHFNPDNTSHGAENAATRHVGDLGNIMADQNGIARLNLTDYMVQLTGRDNVVGRAVVVHQNPDDLGLGNATDSLTTGHAGGRLVCGVIGLVPSTSSN